MESSNRLDRIEALVEANANAIAQLTKRAELSDRRVDNLVESVKILVSSQELLLDKIEGVVNELRHVVRNQ